MKTRSLIAIALLSSTFTAQAETLGNQALNWLIDGNGVPRYSEAPAVSVWLPAALPDSQKAVAISSDYHHYNGPQATDNGYENSTFAISSNGGTFQYVNYNWKRVNGCWLAKDVTSYGIDNSYCVNGDGTIAKFNTDVQAFRAIKSIEGEEAERIDVGSDGVLWVVTNDSDVYKLVNGEWELAHAAGDDHVYPIEIASSGDYVYMITEGTYGSPALQQFSEGGFTNIANFITDMDVDRDGAIWLRHPLRPELYVIKDMAKGMEMVDFNGRKHGLGGFGF